MNNTVQKICKICYIVVIILTVMMWCVLGGLLIQAGQSDDIGIVMAIGFPMLIFGFLIVMLQEYLYYISIRYFLAAPEIKTRKKTLCYWTVVIANTIIVVCEIIYSSFFYGDDYGSPR